MNSIAPITSLTSTLTGYFKKDGKPIPVNQITSNVIENAIMGLEVISERGAGLLNFVSTYRRLTKIPILVINNFNVNNWLNNIKILLYDKLEENKINLDIVVSKHLLSLDGDEKLLTQVVLNLIYNAIDALSDKDEKRIININADKINQNLVQIAVANNGKIIPAEILEKIFIPFFTTKKDGSGIGLSLSKQIIQLHDGYIYVESDNSETRFVIVI